MVKTVFDEYVSKIKNNNSLDNIYPGIMTDLLSGDERIEDFVKYISDISWDVLNMQGYNMDLFYTDASEMWGQYHPKTSSMEKHSHGNGAVLTGFYFLDTPPESSKMFLHDPRVAKLYAGIPVRENSELTQAHSMVYYDPQPGDIFFTDAWLEHSFTRNANELPYNFIHINVRLAPRGMNEISSGGPVIV
jgi:uncharacterized protein (TIGR02466 family)